MKSWKIGAIAGLIAGLVAGPVVVLERAHAYSLGIEYFQIPETFFAKIAIALIVNNLIFGVIMGVIYSKVYTLIPGKDVFKGLIFGMFGYLLFHIYFAFNEMMYWRLDNMISYIVEGFWNWIPFGIVLGILYGILRKRYYPTIKEPKIITYGIMGGIHPGAIAGFIGGVPTFFIWYVFMITGFYLLYPLEKMDMGFLLGQFGSQIMWHMLWGIIFGVIYTKVYNLVPGKGIIKGLLYGLIANFLINEFRLTIWGVLYGDYKLAAVPFTIGGLYAIVFGLIIGAIYKPSK